MRRSRRATPSDVRTTLQNWWMSRWWRESKPASASVSWVRRTSSSWPFRSAGGRSPRSGRPGRLVKAAGHQRSGRTRSRNSWVAARLEHRSLVQPRGTWRFGSPVRPGRTSYRCRRWLPRHGGGLRFGQLPEQVKTCGSGSHQRAPARPAASEARAARRRRPAGCPHRRSPRPDGGSISAVSGSAWPQTRSYGGWASSPEVVGPPAARPRTGHHRRRTAPQRRRRRF